MPLGHIAQMAALLADGFLQVVDGSEFLHGYDIAIVISGYVDGGHVGHEAVVADADDGGIQALFVGERVDEHIAGLKP